MNLLPNSPDAVSDRHYQKFLGLLQLHVAQQLRAYGNRVLTTGTDTQVL